MQYFCIILALIAGIFGMAMLSQAKSAIHEIEAFLIWIIGAIFFAAGLVIDRLTDIRKAIARKSASPKGSVDDEEEADAVYADAVRIHKAGDTKKAKAILQRMIQDYPHASAAKKAADVIKRMP